MRKNIKIIIVFLLCLTFSIITTQAKSYITELFQAGEKVKVDKQLDGTAFLAGNKVDINNKINGIGFIAGNDININSTQEYLFGAGNDITLKNDIEKDLFLAGTNIKIKDSKIKRDAYIAGETIEIDGTIERNIYIYGNSIDLKGNYNGNITINAMNINIDKDAKITGTLKYNKEATINTINKSIKTKTYNSKKQLSFKEYITSFLNSYIHITALAIVLVFMCEKLFKKSLKQTENMDTKKLIILSGKGFLILIGVPIIAMMLMFSGLFVSVGVISCIIYGILVYIANIFTAYKLATVLDKKYFKKNMNSYLLMIVGLFIIYILTIIPFIGGLISFISITLGIAIAGNMIIELKK